MIFVPFVVMSVLSPTTHTLHVTLEKASQTCLLSLRISYTLQLLKSEEVQREEAGCVLSILGAVFADGRR